MLFLAQDPSNNISLSVIDYQFPEGADNYYDKNWLLILGEGSINGRSWSFEDPCLMTSDLLKLSDWFGDLADGGQTEQEILFIEPNISFELKKSNLLRVFLELEARDPTRMTMIVGPDKVYFDVPISKEALLNMRDQINLMLESFPVRT